VSARKQLRNCLGLAALLLLVLAPAAQASFGIKSASVRAVNPDGSVDLQAGSHPHEYTVKFAMNLDSEGAPEGTLRDFIVDLPPGLVGNPLAVPRCSGADFEGQVPHCPANTQIGVAFFRIQSLVGSGPEGSLGAPVYNLTPPLGVAASIGFSVVNENSFQEASLRPSDYGVSVADITVPTNKKIQSVSETIWGVPADPSHDYQRGFCFEGGGECPSDLTPTPFLSLPTSCAGPLQTTLKVDSVQEPNVFRSTSVFSVNESGSPSGLNSCERLPFSPKIAAQPETAAADSPTGLHVNLNVPQTEAPEQLASAHLKDTVLSLPKGLAVNPSVADGLAACPLTGPEGINLPGSGGPAEGEPAKCPAASKLGTVAVKTPLLDHPVTGSVYIARQLQNPFNSLMALYIAVDDPISGVVVKLAGKVEPDPLTGQLKATFLNNPQLPFEDFDVDFTGGPRAPLTTPSTCGTYTTTADLTPWSSPEGASVFESDSFKVTAAAGGGPCVSSEAQAPNKPSFEAGTTTPIAGSYSPFVLKMSRENGSQRLTGLETTLPKGVSAKLAGIPYCSEAQIGQAKSREVLGGGAAERQAPSCPLASEVGIVNVGAGSGSPLFVQGHAYLAGPYKGAPLSFVFITPAVAGPFDLGNTVVRTALYVNPETAQARAVSDPLPQILFGVPLDLRSVAVVLSRPNFSLNPTSCNRSAITGSAITAAGQSAAISSPFQVGACGALGFKPKFAPSLKGATKRTGHPAFRAVLTYPKGGGYANIAKAQVTLPHSEFLDTTHIGTVCTRVQFAANTCPKASIYGKARAFTPLLDKPVEGPVYLRSSNHKLPDLVVALRGQVDIVLAGRVSTGPGNGIRTTFDAAPDAPVSKFVLEMKGGKKGLLINSENICSKPQRATVHLTAHNGKVSDSTPLIANNCAKKSGK
jgi:hypothetical protein